MSKPGKLSNALQELSAQARLLQTRAKMVLRSSGAVENFEQGKSEL
jgi:hypothetical protein